MSKPRKAITIGKEYGWLTVVSEAPRDELGHIKWNVKCRCGKEYAGHRNDVPEPGNNVKKHIEEKCRPFTLESLIARQPVIVTATA